MKRSGSNPTRGASHGNLALGLITLNRYDDAERTVAAAAERNLHSEALLEAAYGLAFLRGDAVAMQRLIEQASDSGDTESLFLDLQAMSEAYIGHLATRGSSPAEPQQPPFTAETKSWPRASWTRPRCAKPILAPGCGHDGTLPKPRASLRHATLRIVACLALARAGEMARSQAMVIAFKQKYPADTLMQGYWLPSIDAAPRARARASRRSVASADPPARTNWRRLRLSRWGQCTRCSCAESPIS